MKVCTGVLQKLATPLDERTECGKPNRAKVHRSITAGTSLRSVRMTRREYAATVC